MYPCTGDNMARMYISEHLTKLMFVKTGGMPAVTGISKKVFEMLLKRRLFSLDIKSAHNVQALSVAEKGYYIFLTPVLREDLLPKVQGVICEIEDKKISLQKMKNWDEVELVTVRLQVKPVCIGRIKSLEKSELDQGVKVEVEKAVRCSIS